MEQKKEMTQEEFLERFEELKKSLPKGFSITIELGKDNIATLWEKKDEKLEKVFILDFFTEKNIDFIEKEIKKYFQEKKKI
ncbi:MAG: hypothetical protein V1910_01970 [bacterium]